MCDQSPDPVLASSIAEMNAVVVPTADLIPVSAVPAVLPPSTATGRATGISTIYRWHQRGLAGVRLPFTFVGSGSWVRRVDLVRFLALVHLHRAGAADQLAASATVPTTPTRKAASVTSSDAVSAALSKRGI